jgi:hypothetical protein
MYVNDSCFLNEDDDLGMEYPSLDIRTVALCILDIFPQSR